MTPAVSPPTTPSPRPIRPSWNSLYASPAQANAPSPIRSQRSPWYDQRAGVGQCSVLASSLASHAIRADRVAQ